MFPQQRKDEEGQKDKRGKFASTGFPGKLTAARNNAPDGATEQAIREVASEALRRECHPSKVWQDRPNAKITDFGGGDE